MPYDNNTQTNIMNELTEEEKQMELLIENERLAFLDSKIASMTPHQHQQALKYLEEQVKVAMNLLKRELPKLGLINRPENPPTIKCVICPAAELKMENGRVPAGVAFENPNYIGILNHLIFAPYEVIQGVAIHECLHQLYQFATDQSKKNLHVRDYVKYEYPEWTQLEEEWVLRAEERITGNSNLVEAWELAIEEGGDNWLHFYYDAKKRLNKTGS